jgi:hypothetical protein
MISSAFAMPRQKTLTSGLPVYDSSKAISPPTVGMPMLFRIPQSHDHSRHRRADERIVERAEPQ